MKSVVAKLRSRLNQNVVQKPSLIFLIRCRSFFYNFLLSVGINLDETDGVWLYRGNNNYSVKNYRAICVVVYACICTYVCDLLNQICRYTCLTKCEIAGYILWKWCVSGAHTHSAGIVLCV